MKRCLRTQRRLVEPTVCACLQDAGERQPAQSVYVLRLRVRQKKKLIPELPQTYLPCPYFSMNTLQIMDT